MARPSTYKKEFANQARQLCVASLAVNYSAIGKLLGVSRETVRHWAVQTENRTDQFQKDFAEALNSARQEIDASEAASLAKVKKAMIKRACGFRFQTTKEEQSGTGEKITCKKTKQKNYQPADSKAAQLVLGNIGPEEDRWYSKQSSKIEGSLDLHVDGLERVMQEVAGSGYQLPNND